MMIQKYETSLLIFKYCTVKEKSKVSYEPKYNITTLIKYTITTFEFPTIQKKRSLKINILSIFKWTVYLKID